MGRAVTVTRTEHTAMSLRSLAAKSDDAAQARRLLALAMVLDGASRAGRSTAGRPGSSDAARLGAPLQPGGCRGSCLAHASGCGGQADPGAKGRAVSVGDRRAGSRDQQGDPLALR